jgi:hypothetical protein
MVLKRKQSGLSMIRPPKIQLGRSTRFRCQYGAPKKPGHSSQIIKGVVGTSIFIVDNVAELQGENRGNGFRIFIRHTNRQPVTTVLPQV